MTTICAIGMYKLRKIIRSDVNLPISTPSTMYKMKNIHKHAEKGSDHVSSFTASSSKLGYIKEQVKRFLKNIEHPLELNTILERQQNILHQLEELRMQMMSLKMDLAATSSLVSPEVLQSTFVCPLEVEKIPEIIINASPSFPPYSLLLIQKLCKNSFNLRVTSHLHSSVTGHENITKFAEAFEPFVIDHRPVIYIRLIWKNVGPNMELILSQIPIIGDVNILRYFSRIIPHILKYETLDNYYEIDYILDVCLCLVACKSKTDQVKFVEILNSKLGKGSWLCGVKTITVADIAAYSILKQIQYTEFSTNMSKWFRRCEAVA